MPTHHLIVGLPGAGKTTFLAALWHVVEYNGVGAGLTVERLDGDREYLNEIRSRWLKCESQLRTSTSSEASVTMLLRAQPAGDTMEISFPDMSGESFRAQWTTRQWSDEYNDLVQGATGVMLFVHPVGISEPHRIDQADELVAALGDVGGGGEVQRQEVPPWNPDDAPTQVQLVELLQFIGAKKRVGMNLAVVISAWDIASRSETRPTEWLRLRLPLLSQYLSANDDTWNTTIFGVSAQGGDFETDAERLLTEHIPAKRIIVVDGDTTSSDITAPVRKLMITTRA